MQINKMNNVTFTQLNPATMQKKEVGEAIVKNIRNIPELDNITKGNPPAYLRAAAKVMKKMAPVVETKVLDKKRSFEDIVNIGNVAKELVCMVVYPAQVLTNPDIPKDKRRFVGMYDFFVTCFSLAGTLLYAKFGKKLSEKAAHAMMHNYFKPETLAKYPKAERVAGGGAFVLGIAVQTILFKRVLAPAFAPPLAAAARRKMEASDAKQSKDADQLPAGTSIALDKVQKEKV